MKKIFFPPIIGFITFLVSQSWADTGLYTHNSNGYLVFSLAIQSRRASDSPIIQLKARIPKNPSLETSTGPTAISTPRPSPTPIEDTDLKVGSVGGAEQETQIPDPIADKIIPPNKSGDEPRKKTVDWSKPIDFNSDDPFNEAHLRQGPTHEVRSKEGRLLFTYADGWDHEGNPLRIIDGIPQKKITKEEFLAMDFGNRKPNNTHPFHVKERASSSRSKRRTGSRSRVGNTPRGLATKGVVFNGVTPLRGFSKNRGGIKPGAVGGKKKSGKSVADLALEKLRSEKWQTLGSGYKQRGRPHRGRFPRGQGNGTSDSNQGVMDRVALGLTRGFYQGLRLLGLNSKPEYSPASMGSPEPPVTGVKNRGISGKRTKGQPSVKRQEERILPRGWLEWYYFIVSILIICFGSLSCYLYWVPPKKSLVHRPNLASPLNKAHRSPDKPKTL